MGENENGRTLTVEPTDNQLQKSALARAGETANRAAADYLFADYRQRRAQKTLRTQRAALLLWVQYLAEVGAANEIRHEARAWALSHFDPETLAGLAEYAQSQQTPLPNYIRRPLLPAAAGRLAGRHLGPGRRLCQMAAPPGLQPGQRQQPPIGRQGLRPAGGQSRRDSPHRTRFDW